MQVAIICIKDKISSNNPKFRFNFVSFEQTLDEIKKLNPKKASQTTDILVPIIIHHNFTNSPSSSSFPPGLKYADLRPVFKKDGKTNKEN